MKAARVFLLSLLIIPALSACGVTPDSTKLAPSDYTKYIHDYHTIEKVGALPDEYTKPIIEKELLIRATRVGDGYLLATTKQSDKNCVTKYDLRGNTVWEKEYELTPKGSRNHYSVVPTPDGGFVLGIVGYTYQKPDRSWFTTDPVIAKCDMNGKLIWAKAYPGFSYTIFREIFCLPDGDVITIGSNEMPETKTVGVISSTDIYLSKLDKNGNLIAEKTYGGSDFDELYYADYIDGSGIAALISSQSRDGTFLASKDGYPVGVVALFDKNLDLMSQYISNQYIGSDDMRCFKNKTYIIAFVNIKPGEAYCSYFLHIIDSNGRLQSSRNIGEGSGIRFTSTTKSRVYLEYPEKLALLDLNGSEKFSIPFTAGVVDKIIEYDDYILVLSTHITGCLPQPPTINMIWQSSELVYSGYDYSGRLLWRDAFDSTPEAFKAYDPIKNKDWHIVGQ